MKRVIKAGFKVLLGAAIWTSGGMVQNVDAQTGGYWEQAQQQQQQQQQQADRQAQEDAMRRNPQYACVGGRDIYGHIGDAACGGDQPTNPKPVVKKPSSYGAVAWDIKRGLYATSHHQLSKQAAFTEAMSKCGSSCQIAMQYANQCTAVAYGLEKGGTYSWTVTAGLTTSKAERDATKKCSKVAKNCQILLSECSLASGIDNNKQQYKGLGE